MATVYRIHPAIGIARVGNSPDQYFVGPERRGERPTPPGGFTDEACRVKRQAARFRVFAHHDDGSAEEVDPGQATITWTVHLVNRKAAHPRRGNNEDPVDLTIDPGSRKLHGILQNERFDGGFIRFQGAHPTEVPLGEAHTDEAGRLLVLGGSGTSASPVGTATGDFWANPDWYDDVSDGPVRATVHLAHSPNPVEAEPAWVIVAPPKFAPHQDSIITLYDRVLAAQVEANLVPAPTTTSFTHDVQPILQRTRDTRWVATTGPAHTTWPENPPLALRAAIFARLTPPGPHSPVFPQNMPNLRELSALDGRLTPVQYEHMRRWSTDDPACLDDWTGSPFAEAEITPDGLDRAALEACVGGPMYPGIEAGGMPHHGRVILNPTSFSAPFRLNAAALRPGDITQGMALPWQADFAACGDNWWPVPRPNYVYTDPAQPSNPWYDRNTSMVDVWHRLSFVVNQPGGKLVERTKPFTGPAQPPPRPTIWLHTPHLHFDEVPLGAVGDRSTGAALPIRLSTLSPAQDLTFTYATPPAGPALYPIETTVSAARTAPGQLGQVSLWVLFRPNAVGAIPAQTVKIRETTTGTTWDVLITATATATQANATALAIEASSAMSEELSDGTPRHDVALRAAQLFVDLSPRRDGVGLVAFRDTAELVRPITTLATGRTEGGRALLTTDLTGPAFDPNGLASFGDAVTTSATALLAAGADTHRALVLLTTGKETAEPSLSDVHPGSSATWAISFDGPDAPDAPDLPSLTTPRGGQAFATGPGRRNDRLRFEQDLVQAYAVMHGADVVYRSEGVLLPGRVAEIPFAMSTLDGAFDAILITPRPTLVDMRLRTATGRLLEPWAAATSAGQGYRSSTAAAFYRVHLPTDAPRPEHAGTWTAMLQPGKPRTRRTRGSEAGIDPRMLEGMHQPWTAARAATRAGISTLPRLNAAVRRLGPAAPFRAGLPYALVVLSYSPVHLWGSCNADNHLPGSRLTLSAQLRFADRPMPATWRATYTPPGGAPEPVALIVDSEDAFAQVTTDSPGIHRVTVYAVLTLPDGSTLTRERSWDNITWAPADGAPTPSPRAIRALAGR